MGYRLEDIIKREKGRSGSNGAWRVSDEFRLSGPRAKVLWHYGTAMLDWEPGGENVRLLSLGWGSVSDQNGLQRAFYTLRVQASYARDTRGGGPRVILRGVGVVPPGTVLSELERLALVAEIEAKEVAALD